MSTWPPKVLASLLRGLTAVRELTHNRGEASTIEDQMREFEVERQGLRHRGAGNDARTVSLVRT